jgi:hypothetical protein
VARKIAIAGSIAVPEPLFVVTDNEGTAGETVIQHVYAPTTATQRTAIAAETVKPPAGSYSFDSTTGLMHTFDGTAWSL